MKPVILFVLFTFFVVNIYPQSWTYRKSENAFDGNVKVSSIVGVGYELPYTKPLFVVNVYEGKTDDPNIYLTNVPSGTCDNNRVLIKFDDDDELFTPYVNMSNDDEIWFLSFNDSDFEEVIDSVKQFIRNYTIPDNQTVKILMEAKDDAPVIQTVPAKEIIELITLDPASHYWTVRYNYILGYVNDMFLLDIEKNSVESGKSTYVFNKAMFLTSKKTQDFIKQLKTHSVMHVRLTSDCVHSDFKFSLKGSAAALNFVLSK